MPRHPTSRQLDHKVKFYSRAESSADAVNAPSYTATLVAERWAKVRQLSGREAEYAARIVDRASHKVTTRYWSGASAAHYLTWEGSSYEIEYVVSDHREDWTEFLAWKQSPE